MSRKELQNPHLTIWKALLAGLYLNAVFTFLSWLLNALLREYSVDSVNLPSTFFERHPLTTGDILLGSGFWPLYLWLFWAWQPRRKHAYWHRWLGTLILGIYLSVLVLLGAIASWNTLLDYPWNRIVNGALVVLLIMAWMLPLLSYPAAKKLTDMQWTLNLRMFGYGVGGVMVLAGILGANFGMGASRNDDAGLCWFMAFALPIIALFLAQSGAEYLWRCRPWAKEGEE